MLQRGRKSGAALATVSALPSRMLDSPPHLPDEQVQVWQAIVATKPADWWQADTAPLLEAYCAATVEHRFLNQLIAEKRKEWQLDAEGRRTYRECLASMKEQASCLKSLGTAMRLTQQSQYGERAAATKARGGKVSKPWGRVEVLDHE